MGASRSEIVRAAWQRRRDPQRLPDRVGHHLHVYPVAAVLVGEVAPTVADPVALGKGAVEQDIVRIRLAQDAQQTGCPVGEQIDDGCRVGVGGSDGDTEPGRELGERVVPAQVRQADQGTLVWRELQWRSPSRVTMSMVTHSTRAWGRSSAAEYGTNAAPVPVG